MSILNQLAPNALTRSDIDKISSALVVINGPYWVYPIHIGTILFIIRFISLDAVYIMLNFPIAI
ncbi:protein of unknown function [Paenibacillus alvei]|uniref:Uncharacterized protein n=1 Tax=Paenibacillus alvei TaxID=44250 RepID=A0A383RAN3_PAEAL|nr:protein of unknown function [Paenibacillus alvei]